MRCNCTARRIGHANAKRVLSTNGAPTPASTNCRGGAKEQEEIPLNTFRFSGALLLAHPQRQRPFPQTVRHCHSAVPIPLECFSLRSFFFSRWFWMALSRKTSVPADYAPSSARSVDRPTALFADDPQARLSLQPSSLVSYLIIYKYRRKKLHKQAVVH